MSKTAPLLAGPLQVKVRVHFLRFVTEASDARSHSLPPVTSVSEVPAGVEPPEGAEPPEAVEASVTSPAAAPATVTSIPTTTHFVPLPFC